MKVFVVEFIGHYPVGGDAVVVAETPLKAKNAINKELKKQGLKEVGIDALTEVDVTKAQVIIQNNGDY